MSHHALCQCPACVPLTPIGHRREGPVSAPTLSVDELVEMTHRECRADLRKAQERIAELEAEIARRDAPVREVQTGERTWKEHLYNPPNYNELVLENRDIRWSLHRIREIAGPAIEMGAGERAWVQMNESVVIVEPFGARLFMAENDSHRNAATVRDARRIALACNAIRAIAEALGEGEL